MTDLGDGFGSKGHSTNDNRVWNLQIDSQPSPSLKRLSHKLAEEGKVNPLKGPQAAKSYALSSRRTVTREETSNLDTGHQGTSPHTRWG